MGQLAGEPLDFGPLQLPADTVARRPLRGAARLPARLRPRPGLGAVRRRRAAPASRPGGRAGRRGRGAAAGAVRRRQRAVPRRSPAAPRPRPPPHEHVLSFLQWLDADRAGLPDVVPCRPAGHAGAVRAWTALERNPALEEAVVWMWRSLAPRRRAGAGGDLVARAPVGAARRRRAGRTPAAGRCSTGWRRPARSATRTSPTWPATCCSTTSTSRCWSGRSATTYIEMREAPRRSRRRPEPRRPGRAGRSGWSAARSRCGACCCTAGGRPSPGFREVLLDVHLRRFYRIRDLRDLTPDERGRYQLAAARSTSTRAGGCTWCPRTRRWASCRP